MKMRDMIDDQDLDSLTPIVLREQNKTLQSAKSIYMLYGRKICDSKYLYGSHFSDSDYLSLKDRAENAEAALVEAMAEYNWLRSDMNITKEMGWDALKKMQLFSGIGKDSIYCIGGSASEGLKTLGWGEAAFDEVKNYPWSIDCLDRDQVLMALAMVVTLSGINLDDDRA